MTTDNLVYDNHMNLVPDVRDNDQRTGMSFVDQSRPISVIKSETIPNDFKDTLVLPRTFEVSGGESIDPTTNPMMVDTRIHTDNGVVEGSNNQYHRLEPQGEAPPVVPVLNVLDDEDRVALESMVNSFNRALESAGYAVQFHGETDPNAPVDLTTLLDEVQYADGLSLRSTQRIETITDMRNEIIELGGITKDQAMAIESLRPQFLSSRVSLETFTRFPSRTNLDIAKAALEDLVSAAAVTGVVITVLAIAKLFQWIIKKIQSFRYDAKSDSVRSTYLRAFKAQMDAIQDTDARFHDVIDASAEFHRIVNAYCNKLAVQPQQVCKLTAIELNDALYHDLTDGKFSDFVHGMYSGETNKLSAFLTTACNNSLISLDAKFRKLQSIADNNAIVNPVDFVGQWKEVADLAGYLTNGTQGTPEQTIQAITFAINARLDGTGKNSQLRFDNAMNNLRYSLDKNFRFDQSNSKRVHNMLGTIKRVEQNLKNIQDPAVRKNRADLYTIFKKEVEMLAILLNSLGRCDAAAVQYISATNQVVKRNGAMWVEAFAAANVHFRYSQ